MGMVIVHLLEKGKGLVFPIVILIGGSVGLLMGGVTFSLTGNSIFPVCIATEITVP